MSIQFEGKPCYCGGTGCYEQYASTIALVKNVSEAINQEVDGVWVFDHLDDPQVFEVYDRWIEAIAMGLVSLTHIFNP